MKQKNNAVTITVVIAVAVIILAAIIVNTSSPYAKDNTITVEGVSEIEATPDFVGVYFSVETDADTSAEATTNNNDMYNALVSALEDEGINSDDIKTQSFNVYKNYEWDGQKQVDKGYRATHQVKIQVPSEEKTLLTSVIDAGVNAGANINYITFELTTESQSTYKAQALELASKDAKVKAEAIANGFDKSVGKLVSVSVSDFGYYPWTVYSAEDSSVSTDQAALARDAVNSIVPTDRMVTGRVSAVYELK